MTVRLEEQIGPFVSWLGSDLLDGHIVRGARLTSLGAQGLRVNLVLDETPGAYVARRVSAKIGI